MEICFYFYKKNPTISVYRKQGFYIDAISIENTVLAINMSFINVYSNIKCLLKNLDIKLLAQFSS